MPIPLPGLACVLDQARRHLRGIALAFMVCFGVKVGAQSLELDVQPVDPSALTTTPNHIVSLRFRVTNRGGDAHFEGHVDVPKDWRLINPEPEFSLLTGQSAIRVVKLQIPADTRQQDYAVTYGVGDTSRLGVGAAARATVRVLAASNPDGRVRANGETLLIDVSVNGRPLAGIIRAERLADGRLVLPVEAWTSARLKPVGEAITLSDGDRGYALEAARGLQYQLDRGRLALNITAPAAAFETSALSMAGGLPGAPMPSPPGVYANYDVSATYSHGSRSYGANLEGVAFNAWGSAVAGAVLQGDGDRRSAVRTETYLRRDLPERMESLVVGDAIDAGGAWSGPVRFGGIRYARDFTLAPGYITYPMPSISGSAALPSTVDVLINNRRSASSNVQPGPFQLNNVPIVTGAGDIQLIVRDLLGRETVIHQGYYVAPQLLAPGLFDFSYDVGALRENYGTQSNDYGVPFGTATYRRGITAGLTGEVRAELQRDRTAAGAAVTVLAGELGVVGVAAGFAASDGEQGAHYVTSFQRASPRGGASIAWDHADRGFRPLGTSAEDVRSRDQLTAAAGLLLGAGMNLGMSYTYRSAWNSDRFSLLGLNFGVALRSRAFVSLNASREMEGNKGWSASINLIVPFPGQRSVSAAITRDVAGETVATAQAVQTVGAGPGWGWRVAASNQESQRLQAGVTRNGNSAQLLADINAGRDSNALRVGATGSLGWFQGLAFASRRIDQGAFAVVRVGDLEGMPVSLSNQVSAVTNASGRALVTGLLPYQSNQLTLNPDLLPLDVDIQGVRETVIPFARAGVFIDFPVRRSRNALLVLHRPDGSPVPLGARVRILPGEREFIVAKRGEVYLMDLGDAERIEVRWKGGGCALALPAAQARKQEARMGPLTCGGGL